jgi:Tfp pilus assembly protein PilX
MRQTTKMQNVNESGFAAIVIAIVLVLVLSLLTVGFAQLMRHEQRQALDKQLSSQAYYAAESGLNDATKAINAGYTAAKTDCDITGVNAAMPGANNLLKRQVGTSTAASYTCLLINPNPPSAEYSKIDTEQAKVVELTGSDSSGNPQVVSTISISWEDSNGGSTFASNCNTLTPAPSWPTTGILRVQLIPLNNLSRDGLRDNSLTGYLCPDGSAPTNVDYPPNHGINTDGVIVHGNCAAVRILHCTSQITGLGGLGQATYLLAMRSIYNPTRVSIKLYGGNGAINPGNELNVSGAQTLVDSTGKAQDVLRRIQVRIPSHNNFFFPDSTQANICKQLDVYSGFGASGGTGC